MTSLVEFIICRHRSSPHFFNKVAVLKLYKKVTPARLFSWEFCKFSKSTYFEDRLRTAAYVMEL